MSNKLATKLVFLASISICSVQVAFAELPMDGFYFGAQGGLSFIPEIKKVSGGSTFNYKYDMAYQRFDGIIGYKTSPVRYEFEGNFAQFDGKDFSGKTEIYGALVNFLYDFQEVSMEMTPFLGAGIGFGHVETKSSTLGFAGKNDVIAYQAKVGLAYHFSSDFSGILSYKYYGTSSVKHMGDKSFQSHSVNVGFLWYFN